jgi:hypothetical protein
MRYLGAGCPEFRRVLVVESGSRNITEAALPRLREVFGPQVTLDLITCYPDVPNALTADAKVWRTQEHSSREARRKLIRDLLVAGTNGVAVVCSAEPIMTRWKWWLAWNLPAKILIVNENADAFWLDRTNARIIRQFATQRLGLRGVTGGEALGRVLVFPFLLAYLLLYAAVTHARRSLRLAFSSRNS